MSKEDILNAIAEMSVMDIVELIDAMEEKFGVTAAAAVAAQCVVLYRRHCPGRAALSPE